LKNHIKMKTFYHLLLIFILSLTFLNCTSKTEKELNSKIIVLGVYAINGSNNLENDTIGIFEDQIQVDSILSILSSSKSIKIKNLEYDYWIDLLIYKNEDISKKIVLKYDDDHGNYFVYENKVYNGDEIMSYLKDNFLKKQSKY
jgi:hypothetical protein